MRATAFIGQLKKSLEPLLLNPLLGPARHHLSQGLRAWPFQRYISYYVVTEDAVIIVRIVHGERDQAALFVDP